MARISEQELAREIESWHTMLSKIDQSVKTPDSLRGSALRHKLDALAAPKEQRGVWPWRLFEARPIVSYAVMFALIIAVYYGVRGSTANQLTESQFTIYDTAASQESAFMDGAFTGGGEIEFSPIADAEAPATARNAMPSLFSVVPEDENAGADMGEAVSVSPEAGLAARSAISDNTAIGGAGHSVMLGEWNDCLITWRPNDPADPEKKGAITVEAATRDASIMFRIDVEGMTEISDFLIEEDILILIGRFNDMGVVRSYSGLTELAPVFTGAASQPGARVATRIYSGVVYTASFSEEGENPDNLTLLPLEGSLDSGICYITALNASTGETGILGLEHSGGDISLFDRHVYISFTGSTEEGGTEVYVAQVALADTNITLSGIH